MAEVSKQYPQVWSRRPTSGIASQAGLTSDKRRYMART